MADKPKWSATTSGSSFGEFSHVELLSYPIRVVVFVLSVVRAVYVLVVNDLTLKLWKEHPQGDAEGPETIIFAPYKDKYVYNPRKLRKDSKQRLQTLRFVATVVDFDDPSIPISGATVDAWQQDPTLVGQGFGYHNFDYEFRGKFLTDSKGSAEILTLRPCALDMADAASFLQGLGFKDVPGRRPEHIHFHVSAPGYRPLINQVYFDENVEAFDTALLGAADAQALIKRRKEVLSVKLTVTPNDPEAELTTSFTFQLMKAGKGGLRAKQE